MSRIRLVVAILILLMTVGASDGFASPAATPFPAPATPPVPDVTAFGSTGGSDAVLPAAPQGGGCTGCTYKGYAPNRFISTRSDLTYRMYGGGMQPTAVFSGWGFMVSLDLPKGANVQQMTLYFRDNSATDMDFIAYRYNFLTPGFTTLAVTTTTQANSSIRTLTLPVTFVADPTQYDYVVEVRPREANGPQEIWGLLVAYKMSTSLPVVMNSK